MWCEIIKLGASLIMGGIGGAIVSAKIQNKHLSYLQGKHQIFETKIQPTIVTLEKALITIETPSEIDVDLLAELSARLKLVITEVNDSELTNKAKELKTACINYRRCFADSLNDTNWQQNAHVFGEQIEDCVKNIIDALNRFAK